MRIDHATGFTLYVPNDWKVVEDPSPEIAILALAPPNESGFARNITVTVGVLEDEWRDVSRWQLSSTQALLSELEDAQLIDVVLEDDAFRHVISHVAEGRALTLEQWGRAWSRKGLVDGVTVSATTHTLDYVHCVDEMTEIAWSLHPTGEEQA